MSTVLGQPVTLGGEGAVKYNAAQTLTVEQKEQAQKNIGVTWPCNPNLLDNWYFGNPVNQRGQTSYSGSYVYGIDRWRQANITYNVAAGTVTPDSAGAAEAKIFQAVACKSNELAMTFSVLCDKGLFSVTSPAGGNVSGVAILFVEFGRLVLWDVAANTDFRYAELRFDSATMQTTTLIAVKLELGTEQTLAHQDSTGAWVLNEIPDYHTELLKCTQSTADPDDTYANKVVTTMDRVVNPNLLDNWYFGNPVNQRGQSSYSLSSWSGYTIDRWRVGGEATTVTVGTGDIQVSGRIVQIVPDDIYKALIGKKVTVAAKIGGVVGCASGTISSVSVWTQYAYTSFGGGRIDVHSSPDVLRVGIFASSAVSVEWIALYEGEYTVNALPRFQIPDYGEQLARCQRYFLRLPINDTLFLGNTGASNGSGVSMFIATPVEMRTDPVISNFTANAYTRTGMVSNINFSSISCGKTPGGIGLYATASKAISSSPTYTDCVYQVYSTPLDISADL